MAKLQIRSHQKRVFRLSRYFVSVFLLLFIVHEIVVFYLLAARDRRIGDLEKELRGLSIRFGQIKQENTQLKERQRILDIIEEFNPGLTEAEKTSLNQVIWQESNRYGYDPVLLMAVILTESTFRPEVQSGKGARGLMQILPSLGEQLSPELAQTYGVEMTSIQDLHDPKINVQVGSYYLFKLVLQFRDVKTAVKAYNEGPNRIKRRIRRGHPMPQVYYSKVLKNYRKLEVLIEAEEAEQTPESGPRIALAAGTSP